MADCTACLRCPVAFFAMQKGVLVFVAFVSERQHSYVTGRMFPAGMTAQTSHDLVQHSPNVFGVT